MAFIYIYDIHGDVICIYTNIERSCFSQALFLNLKQTHMDGFGDNNNN